ncbi:MAG: carboxypeptidase regulatory-like domain-containing protein, partial [Lachnospiraceae bacterium]|nr:carboxypeptidase regulatory-like domain-containing protein [Lachnospiraceae bacterium]
QPQGYAAQPQMQGQSLMQPNAQPQPGAQPQANTAQGTTLVAKKKKPWVKFVVIGAIILAVAGIVAGMFAFGAVDKINSRIKTASAEKYFADMDYENAIASYLDAIEIDPTNVEAYLGLADVYIALDDFEAAIDILEEGAQATGSDKIEDRLEEVYELDRCIFGYVYKVDVDTDPSNNEPLVGAKIELTFPDGDITTYTTDDNGYYETEKELPSGKYEIRYYYENDEVEYAEYTESIKAEEGKIEKNVYLEPLIYANLHGVVLIGDDDTDYTNNYGLEDAEVKIEKINSSNNLEQATYTDYDGRYDFSGLTMGVYKLTVHKDGFIDVTQNVVVYEGQTEVYNSLIELISSEYQGNGNAQGTIYDAVTGYGVEGLSLYIRSGINNTEGSTVGTTKTESDGTYTTPDLPSGNYCIQVIDERDVEEPYISTQINVKILGGITIYNQDATVSSVLMDGQLRIVLTWGSHPSDLDSHLLINIGGNHSGHVYFGDENYYCNGEEIADLDLDDTSSYGPETTTIYNPMDGDFLFYVYNYSGNSMTGLSDSGATVMVYKEGATSPSYVFYVPAGEGYTWDVFSYDSTTGIITPINEIAYSNYYSYDAGSDSWVNY